MMKVSVAWQWILLHSMICISSNSFAQIAKVQCTTAVPRDIDTGLFDLDLSFSNDFTAFRFDAQNTNDAQPRLEDLFQFGQDAVDVHDEIKKLDQRISAESAQTNENETREDVSVLEHTLWKTNQLRVYQHTQYNAQNASDKFKQGAVQQIGLEDLSLSVGYGMEYFLNPTHAIGYEYVSSFPYDRGQSIRVFWIRLF